MDYCQHLVSTLLCFVMAEGGRGAFVRSSGAYVLHPMDRRCSMLYGWWRKRGKIKYSGKKITMLVGLRHTSCEKKVSPKAARET